VKDAAALESALTSRTQLKAVTSFMGMAPVAKGSESFFLLELFDKEKLLWSEVMVIFCAKKFTGSASLLLSSDDLQKFGAKLEPTIFTN